MKKIALALVLSSSFFTTAGFASTLTLEDYSLVFQGDNKQQQRQAMESLILSGFDDPSIFDNIEAKLTASLPLATTKNSIDYSSWLAKSLGYSGNEKYQPTLQGVVNGNYHKKLRKYAQEGLTNISQFALWNPILNNKNHFDESQPRQLNVLANAIASGDLELKRIAAKKITNERIYNEYILQKLAEQLTSLDQLQHTKLSIDTYAWLAKALASSGDEKFKSILVTLSESAPEEKLQRYAKKYLKSYY
ncbi:hypothetical protein [Shewanella aestuarii]|uniref:HEAT repeat domain-containing protein n=1 Tax=Shewanella aestuarii TaxID=1028752 RepID=A0A6G9QHB4_9GAMM|nr:hypothetical protein [Shewanella aestuarii]QIR13291.1 hypothetical protein HBH39_01310 [Shewanella aestuarii]